MVRKSIRFRHFVGRSGELAALEDARKSLAKSSGSFVLLSGEAGIGKTRLLTEFIAAADNRRARTIVNTECLQRAQQPLGPVRALLRSLARTNGLAELPPSILRALAQVIPESLPPSVVASHESFTLEKEPLFAAIVDYLGLVCAKRATVLTVEDIHWAEGSTLEFLHYVAHRMRSMRLLIVATYRGDELDINESLLVALSPLLREKAVLRVALEPLRPHEIRELVNGATEGQEQLPEPALLDIERLSEGNPFFAEELLSDYFDRLSVNGASAKLPLSIRASITARLNVMTVDERTILKYAATLGARFDPDVLAVVLAREHSDLTKALGRAHALGLLVDSDRGRMSLRFRHALIRQTIYEEIPAFEARELHARILATLEAQADASDHVEELAYHAWESANPSKSLQYSERAGEATFALRALPEALVCFTRALESTVNITDRARILERIGAIERLLGHSLLARDAFETALEIRLELGEYDAAALDASGALGQRYNLGDVCAVTRAEEFLAKYGDRLSDEARNRLLVTCARTEGAVGNMPSAKHFIERVVHAEELPVSVRFNYIIVQLMRHAYYCDAIAWRRVAQEVTDFLAVLTPDAVVGMESALALTGVYLAENETVEAALERAERIAFEWTLRGPRAYNSAVSAAYLYQRGNVRDAVARVKEVAATADVLPAIMTVVQFAAHLATTTGDPSVWHLFGDGYVRQARENPRNPDNAFLLAAYAAWCAKNGELKAAQADIRSALAALAYATADGMFVLIIAARLLPQSEQERVVSLTHEAASGASEVAMATEAFVGAIRASRFGSQDDAMTLGHKAALAYAAFGWPLLEAAALETAGAIEAARRIYDRCGASGDLARLNGAPIGAARKVWDILSPREAEIARLVATGQSNREIAAKLAISIKSVERHLSSMFDKLNVRSRTHVAALVIGSR